MDVMYKPSVDGKQILAIVVELVECFNLLLPLVNADQGSDKPSQTGGCFRIWQSQRAGWNYLEVAVMCVGELLTELPDYLYFSHEKAERLAKHPILISSWQTRVEMLQMYGGAIRCGQFILSFSGFPERWDEILMLLVARRCQLIDEDQQAAILQVSRNEELMRRLPN
jgi:hypothetical protein